ncbi:hypothetical protein HYW55_03135 [Candidatus Gottesmanbacteria bacterium]|nr:hypothetical protein [Candidatus Gottesmanbacteria bacterium]
MKYVRIIKNWEDPNILRQTPKSLGIWDDVRFTLDPIEEYDYVLVLNYPKESVKVRSYPKNVWCLVQEPPNEFFKYALSFDKNYHRIFTQDTSLHGEKFILSQPATPWLIDRDYDALKKMKMPSKTRNVSFITSKKMSFQGHRDRMRFLEKIKGRVHFDLYGFGFKEIADKWEGLAPYRYTLVVENYSGPYYWSEKLSDAYLAFTMPIYFGCTNITDFFPKESFVSIDINDKDCIEKLNKIIKSDIWKKNLKYVANARNLILEKYQFFPYMTTKIHQWENRNISKEKRTISLQKGYNLQNQLIGKLKRGIKTFVP